jgi:Golgi apparatus protein 1
MLKGIITREGTMKKSVAVAFAFATIISSSTAFAQQNLAADCAPDIAKYCSSVTPGAHRIVACLISFEDKISPRCRMTAYLGSDDLGVRMKALKAMAKSCSADILQYCSSVSAGGGRIYDCLMKNKATLTDECRNQVPTAQQFMND